MNRRLGRELTLRAIDHKRIGKPADRHSKIAGYSVLPDLLEIHSVFILETHFGEAERSLC